VVNIGYPQADRGTVYKKKVVAGRKVALPLSIYFKSKACPTIGGLRFTKFGRMKSFGRERVSHFQLIYNSAIIIYTTISLSVLYSKALLNKPLAKQ